MGDNDANTLKGYGGDDTLVGLSGDDILVGGEGEDFLDGGEDDDNLNGGDGDDLLFVGVGEGNGTLIGGSGDNRLVGGEGDDALLGGVGNDKLEGGEGDDILLGGEGNDTSVWGVGESSNSTILDFNPAEDTIEFSGLSDPGSILVTETEDGSTLITAGSLTLTVDNITPDQFGTHNITIKGQQVEAPDGFDLGGALRGDAVQVGDGFLGGSVGNDTLVGGSGDDVLVDGDLMRGGDRNDTFVWGFGEGGNSTILDFNPDEDTIDFSGLADPGSVLVTETEDGGTLITAGSRTLTVDKITPDQFSTNDITIDGKQVEVPDGFDLAGILRAEDASATASALSAALDGTTEQGRVASDRNRNEVASDQALLDEANLDQDEKQDDADELFS